MLIPKFFVENTNFRSLVSGTILMNWILEINLGTTDIILMQNIKFKTINPNKNEIL